MPVSGVVISLCDDEAERAQAMSALRADRRITLGEPCGHRLPIVCETTSTAEDEILFEGLHALPGVILADLVFVDFSDVSEFGEGRHVVSMRGRVTGDRRKRSAMSQEVRS